MVLYASIRFMLFWRMATRLPNVMDRTLKTANIAPQFSLIMSALKAA